MGTGMYLVAGLVAHKVAGPGVIISFIIAAVASIFSGKFDARIFLNALNSLSTLNTFFHNQTRSYR